MFVFAEDGDFIFIVTHSNGPSVADPTNVVQTTVTKFKLIVEEGGEGRAHLLPLAAKPDRLSDIARNETELRKIYKNRGF
jgi:hypothetical protein